MPSLSQRIREVAAAVSSVLCLTSEHVITDTSSTSDRTVVAASHDEKISTSTSNSTITSTIIPAHDLSRFENDYPQYALTLPLDLLRRREYMRLSSNSETYVDYMGGSLYPESLVGDHARLLQTRTFGNTHSINSTSARSSAHADMARKAVLNFFDAPSEEYTVIFTSNASSALKLVGEAFPFSHGGSYVLGEDAHNSIHGIRRYASAAGASVHYIPATSTGGFDERTAEDILTANTSKEHPSLFALTGLSNVSNHKPSWSVLQHASDLGVATLLDAAALAATSRISLKGAPVDAMAISFYKLIGYPTGVGALIAKKSFLSRLRRPWFAGGTVDVVQVPGTIATPAHELHELFEDGTINYLSLPVITAGLGFLRLYLPFLPVRLSTLLHYLSRSLSELRHPSTGGPAASILSHLPSEPVKYIGEASSAGFVLSFLFLDPRGEPLPLEFIEHASASRGISLRTGCMCNPGGSAVLLGLGSLMKRLDEVPDASLAALERMAGRSLGVVRVSLGIASNFEDAWRVVAFARELTDERARSCMWEEWKAEPRT